MSPTPEEKAKELVATYITDVMPFVTNVRNRHIAAKACALIAVGFAIEAVKDCSVVAGYPLNEYQQVKESILKL